jgi:hypothetical protein
VKRKELRLIIFGIVVWRRYGSFLVIDKVAWNGTPRRVTAPFVSMMRGGQPAFHESSCLGLQL